MQSQELPSFEGYRLLKLSFVQGEVFEVFIPRGWTPQTTRSYLTHVEGEVECRRTQHGLVDVKKAGDTTGTAPGVVQQLGPLAGRLTYKVQTPTYAYLCLTRNDGQPIAVQDIRLASGGTYTVPAGKVALLVLGGDNASMVPVKALATGATILAGLDNTLLLEVTL